MTDLLQAATLGIVQGLTEFLPISSTAHLVLVPWLMGWEDPGLAFDVSLHMGTLVAVVAYFYKDILSLATGFFRSITQRNADDPDQRLAWLLILGMIPAGIAGLLFEHHIESTLRSPYVIATALIGVAGLLWYADRWRSEKLDLTSLNWKKALLIGCAQAIALIPGVSRSGITITAGLFNGLSREAAARYSFLMGTPLIAAGGVLKLKEVFTTQMTGDMIAFFFVGFLASMVSGYFCIRFLMKFIQNNNFDIFVIYRILLGILVFSLAGQIAVH